MFEENPSRRAKIIAAVGLIAVTIGLVAVSYLLNSTWGSRSAEAFERSPPAQTR